MFFKKERQKELIATNCIYIHDMEYFYVLASAVAKTMQIDFGLRWDVDTAQEDDERAVAIAIAGIYELGGQIVSEDAEVMKYVARLQNNQSLQKYYKEEK